DDDLTEPGFSGELKEPGDMNDAYQANISEFVRWVKQKAPMVNKVRVEVNDSLVAENDHDGHFSSLVPQLYRLGTRIEYTCNNGRIAPEASQLNEIRGLVHISYLGNDAWNQFMHLARQNVQTLQYLNLDSRGFGDVAGLIQDPDGSYVTAKLSEYMVSTYAPMGKRFRCWHIGRYAGNVECMILLALACPNFDYVAMDQEERKPFMKDLKMFIGLDRFKPYAPRLCRLLFNGGQNC
ncbi:hypothetical protein GGH93_006338, partial [Coemansia aciculifera]